MHWGSPPNSSAQGSGIPRPHGGDLGPPVSGVAGANVEWPLGRDPPASCVTGASFVWLLGRGGAEGGLIRVLKQADPLRTTGTGARGDAEAGGTQRSIGEALPNVGASSISGMNLRSAHSPKVMR